MTEDKLVLSENFQSHGKQERNAHQKRVYHHCEGGNDEITLMMGNQNLRVHSLSLYAFLFYPWRPENLLS